MATVIYRGHVVGHKVMFDDTTEAQLDRDVSSHEGHGIEMTIRRQRSQRSLDQNAYLHGCVFGPLGEELGYTMSEIKLVLMGECWGWKTVAGHEVPIKPATSEMSVEDATHFIDWVIPFALEKFNFAIMLPGEVDV